MRVLRGFLASWAVKWGEDSRKVVGVWGWGVVVGVIARFVM